MTTISTLKLSTLSYLLLRFVFKIALAVCFIMSFALQGQSRKEQFQHIGVREGLSHTSVFHIYQTQKGELLFGTANGLNKYNGYDFDIFYADMADSTAISHGNISGIWEDPVKGYIWIATWGGGVNRLDPHTQHFKHYLPDSTNSSLSDGRVQSLLPEGDHTLWLGTFSGGLNKFNRETGDVTVYEHQPDSPQSISHNRIWDIKEGEDGILWLATGQGLNLFDTSTGLFQAFYPNPSDITHSDNTIRCLWPTEDGLLWVGTQNGLLGFDTDKKRFLPVPIQQKWDANNNPAINYLMEYPKGILWMCTQRNGLVKYDYHRGHYEQYLYDALDPYSISDNDIRYIYPDASNVLWVATRRAGLSRFSLQDKQFTTYTFDPSEQQGLRDKQVISLAGNDKGEVWVGTTLGGVDKITADGEVSHLPFEQGEQSLIFHEVTALHENREGLLWVGTERGLDQYDTKSEKFRHFSKETPSSRGLQSERIAVIYEDLTSRLWLGTKDEGLHYLDVEADTFVQVPNSYGNYSKTIQCLTDGPPRQLWVGTEGGLFRLDTRSMEYFFIEEVAQHSIRHLYKDKGNLLWIGTTHGLIKFNIDTKEITSFTSRDGLPSNQIDGILPADNCLWISTGRGLSRMDLEKQTFRNYDMEDGLQSNVFSMGACYKNPFGKMYFGGIEGLNVFYSKDISENTHKPAIILTKFSKMGKPIRFAQPLHEIEQINLLHTENVFSFEFAALDYAQPQKNEYAYRLDGYDDDWVYVGNTRTATYSHIPPGDYTFRVKGSNNDKVWNEEGTAISIVMHPPFWRTIWFYTLCVLLVVGTSIFYALWRINMLKKQRKHLGEQVALRTHELEEERDKLQSANIQVVVQLEEIEAQRDEIEAQRDDIIQKNRTLEGAIDEIRTQNNEIRLQKSEIEQKQFKLEHAQAIIQEKNEQLVGINQLLEGKVKKRTKELNEAYKDLLRAHKQLDHFTYRSAHDLKGPIARLLGLCYLAKIEIHDPKAIGYITRLEDNAREMNVLIARLMRAYEVKTKNIDLDYLSLGTNIKQVLETVSIANGVEKTMQFLLDFDKEIILFTDLYLIEVLLENLIINSIHFRRLNDTDNKLRISFQEESKQVRIIIEDWGIGVPPAIADNLFDMFVIGSEQSQGVGLGLYEAQIIVQRLKGKIWLEEYEEGKTSIGILMPTKF